MKITDIKISSLDDQYELSANISADTARKGDFCTWFRWPKKYEVDNPTADPYLAGFLIPCMQAAEDLYLDGTVSQKLLNAVPQIQAQILSWYPDDFQKIKVHVAQTDQSTKPNQRSATACCFSAGADSWYSLLKNQNAITHLLLIQGFDIKGSEKEFWQKTHQSVSNIATELNKELLTIQTNLKKTADPRKSSWGRPYSGRFWRYCYQGSALAACSLCLQGPIGRLYIPSSYSTQRLIPFGSHPDLDPLWSTESLEVEHDGCDAGRYDKIQHIVQNSRLALENLRVCLENIPGEYNCCRCEKCMRTMIILQILHALDKAVTFHRPLQLGEIRRMYLEHDLHAVYQEYIKKAQAANLYELAQALQVALGQKTSWVYQFNNLRHQMLQILLGSVSKKTRAHINKQIGPFPY